MTQRERGDGETTRQMKAAPQKSVYIWCNGQLEYPRLLASKLGREDLQIVGPGWLDDHRFIGTRLTGITIDHATRFTEKQVILFHQSLYSVRGSELR